MTELKPGIVVAVWGRRSKPELLHVGRVTKTYFLLEDTWPRLRSTH